MATQSRFRINGFVDTNRTIWENVEEIASAASAWVTWDSTRGQWALVINQATSSSMTFDDDNIVGNIRLSENLNETGYTAGEMKFPSRDIGGVYSSVATDILPTVNYADASFEIFRDEDPNILNITNRFVNNTVQAQLILYTELRQSRKSLVVEFETDFRAIGLRAGDVIDITNSYLFNNPTTKQFRIVSIKETDGAEGEILLSITGVEYDTAVYNYTGFTQFQVDIPEMPPIQANTAAQTSNADAYGNQVNLALNSSNGLTNITQDITIGGSTSAGIPLLGTLASGFTASEMVTPLGSGSSGTGTASLQWELGLDIKTMQVTFQQPQATYNYTVDSVSKSITAAVPCVATLQYSTNGSTWSNFASQYMEWSTYLTIFNVSNATEPYWRIVIGALNTYDLNATNNFVTIDSGITSGDFITNADGFAAVVSIMAFLE